MPRRSDSGPSAFARPSPASGRSRSAGPRPAPASTPIPNSPPRSGEKLSADTGLDISEPADPFEAQANRDALVELSGALKTVAVSLLKIGNDLALMGSGPACRASLSSACPSSRRGRRSCPARSTR